MVSKIDEPVSAVTDERKLVLRLGHFFAANVDAAVVDCRFQVVQISESISSQCFNLLAG